MRPQKARDALHALGILCDDHDIELKIVERKGSHRGLVFRDKKTGKEIGITISANNGEISPGVQRGTLKYVASLATDHNVAELIRGFAAIVRSILEAVFRSS